MDIWEISNEVNGKWTGEYSGVSAKIYDVWQQVHAAGKRTELTLWYDAGCGNSPPNSIPSPSRTSTCPHEAPQADA